MLRDLARVARDRRRMPGGHRVAHRQCLQDRREQAHLQRGELACALGQLLPTILGLDAGAQDVEEDEEDHRGQADRRHAEVPVGEGDARRQEPGGELRRQRRDEGSEHPADRDAVADAGRRGDHGEVEGVGRHEDAEDGGGEPEGVPIAGVEVADQRADGEPAEQRERRERGDVDEQAVQGASRNDPVDQRAGDREGGGRRRAEQRHRQDDRQERARQAQALDLKAEQFAAGGEHEEQAEQRQRRPVAGAARVDSTDHGGDEDRAVERGHNRALPRHLPRIRHVAVAFEGRRS